MPGGYYKADVTCPFYRFDDGRRKILCEGILDGSTVGLCYGKKADFSLQIREFCCRRYQNCEINRMLMENKYDD